MTILPPSLRKALEYVRNTNGGATKDHFIEDFEPIGKLIWGQVEQFVMIDENGKIHLSDTGKAALL